MPLSAPNILGFVPRPRRDVAPNRRFATNSMHANFTRLVADPIMSLINDKIGDGFHGRSTQLFTREQDGGAFDNLTSAHRDTLFSVCLWSFKHSPGVITSNFCQASIKGCICFSNQSD